MTDEMRLLVVLQAFAAGMMFGVGLMVLTAAAAFQRRPPLYAFALVAVGPFLGFLALLGAASY